LKHLTLLPAPTYRAAASTRAPQAKLRIVPERESRIHIAPASTGKRL